MPLFKKTNQDKEPCAPETSELDVEADKKIHFLTSSLHHSLITTRELIDELKEKETKLLSEITETLIDDLKHEQVINRSYKTFDQYKKQIKDLIKIHKTTIQDKEKEFKDIIGILSKAIATFDQDNQSYYQTVFQQSEQLDALRQLDDIREIKRVLTEEVTFLRENLENKKNQDQKSLVMLSDQVQILKEELAKAKEENHIDPLTGAYNRLAYDEKISAMVSEYNKGRKVFSMIVFDIDHFKNINDQYGHQYGDRALMAVVGQCRQHVRDEDFIARYGGDEFVILLPNANLKVGLKKAKIICQLVEETKYVTGDDTPPIDITISMGVSAFRKNDTPQSLFDRADKALYVTKQKGRNGVNSEG